MALMIIACLPSEGSGKQYALIVKVWNADAGHLEPASLSLIISLQHSTLTVNSNQHNTCLPIVPGNHKWAFSTKWRLMDTLQSALVNISKHHNTSLPLKKEQYHHENLTPQGCVIKLCI